MISAPLYFSPVLFWTKGSYSCGSKTHKGDGVLWITAKQSAPGQAAPIRFSHRIPAKSSDQ